MNGYPTYVGDQSHIVMTGYDTLGTVKKDISSSTTQAWFGANASDLYQAVADDGTVYEFTEYAVTTDDRQLAWVIEGNDLKLYVNSWLSSTKDVTGKTFTLDRYGADVDGTTGDTEAKNGYPKALSQEEVKFWSYLRDADGNILPLLPSEPPSAPVTVNSSRIGPSFQGYNAGNTTGLQLTTQGAVYVWVKSESPSSTTLIFSKSQYTGDQQGYEIRTQGSKYLVSISSDGSGSGSNVTQISTTSDVTSLTYTLVGFEYDGANLSISYDGQIQNSVPYTSDIHNSSAPFMISGYGGSNQGEFPFNGSVFQPLVYKRALSQVERDAIYNGGTPVCFDLMVSNQPSLSDAEYAPRLGNWGTNAGQETVDQSGNGITTTPINSPTYTNQDLKVQCTN